MTANAYWIVFGRMLVNTRRRKHAKGLRLSQESSGSVRIYYGPTRRVLDQSCISEKEKKLFRESREAEEKADQEESDQSDVGDTAGPQRIANLIT